MIKSENQQADMRRPFVATPKVSRQTARTSPAISMLCSCSVVGANNLVSRYMRYHFTPMAGHILVGFRGRRHRKRLDPGHDLERQNNMSLSVSFHFHLEIPILAVHECRYHFDDNIRASPGYSKLTRKEHWIRKTATVLDHQSPVVGRIKMALP